MKKIFTLLVIFVLLFNCSVTSFAVESEYTGRTDFIWGCTAHDYTYPAYKQDAELYIKTIAELGVDAFRIGFNYTVTTLESLEYLDKCVKLCDEYGLKKIVLLKFASYSDLELNTQYFEMIASRYNGKNGHGFIDIIEVGAEEDAKMLENKWPNGNGPNGDSIEHYYESDLIKYQNLYASCIKGIRNASSDIKVMIDFAHLHYAPLLYMYEHGLDFDILGLDWYVNMGPLNKVLDPVLEKFPHDIIVSETNIWPEANTNHEDVAVWNPVVEFMDIAYDTQRVKGLLFYELMDEPNLDNWGEEFVTEQAHFGLCYTNMDASIKGYKPIYYHLQDLLGGGPVVKRPVDYGEKTETPSEPSSVITPSTSVITPSTSEPSEEYSSFEEETESSNETNVESSTENQGSDEYIIKEVVTTTTKKIFPWKLFIIGSGVILLLTGAVLLFRIIRPIRFKNIKK